MCCILTQSNQLVSGEFSSHFDIAKYSKAEQPTIQRGGGIVGRGVESVQHLFTPGSEAVLRLHALQQLQQLLLLICPLTAHHVLITAENAQGSMHSNHVY